ncbi:MAG: hypothetical protein HYT38_00825 [Candidatus Sungbacteria bacterium]|uniref:Uncharacterized protein n=1 Tax=Candidatus Sungiibacteriota bacterium TaxID=2750080 RepID=A0A931YD10_9BACT|nr:hypothetical protein [Candidatus Sungbacteria bacterium]MBI2465624.1 hypothetical protein [Candidatus Sungbacteria bacterium]
MTTVASRVYKPSDFSEGLWHEVLVTLGKKGFSPEMAAEMANTKSGKADQVVAFFRSVAADPAAFFQKFYRDFCGLNVDFSTARVPEPKGDLTRILGISQGLTSNRMFEACQNHFPCWRYTEDLNQATQGLNEREPTQSYFIRVRDRAEADGSLKNLSAVQIKDKGLTTETLLERLVHEGVYFYETGHHLDTENSTLCSGSRLQDGNVPRVYWHRDKFKVNWYFPQFTYGLLRARAVVS